VITGLNSTESMDVYLLCLLCRQWPLQQADHLLVGVQVFVSVCDLETSVTGSLGPSWAVVLQKKNCICEG
jgi:hypothetical protein